MRKIELKVIARAKDEGIKRLSETSYRVKLSVAPEKGKANKRLIELLSEELGVQKRHIRIISGEFSSRKIVTIGP